MRRRHARRPTPWLRYLGILLVLLLLYFLYSCQRYNYLISTPVNADSSETVPFTIKKGDNIKTIAENLYQKQLILDRDSFAWYSRLNNLDKEVKSGVFDLQQSENIQAIFQIITSNKTRQAIVTIPEGSTVQDIDTLLSDQGLGQPGDYIKAVQAFDSYQKYPFLNKEKQSALIHPLEGYLFPDTYYVSASSYSPENLISMQLNTFAKKALPIAAGNSHSLADIINVAAMVEKEANKDEDRPIVAGIIWKRLDSGWVLGIDATLLYLKNDHQINYQDLKDDNPYNTRLKQGLPPGPIANPGLASISAAANPKETSYFFYLTSKDGQMIYAETNEQHNANKLKYL